MRIARILTMISALPLYACNTHSTALRREQEMVRRAMAYHLMPKNTSGRLSTTMQELYYNALVHIPIAFKADKAYIEYGKDRYEFDIERKNITIVAHAYK